jgi:ribosomal protein L40E
VSGRRHAEAIAQLLADDLEAGPAQATRRLLRPQVRWVADNPDERLARDLGILDAIERCRDRHLAVLGPDDGLSALGVSWQEIAVLADRLLDRSAATFCWRCGARLGRRAKCRRCRLSTRRAAGLAE